MELLRRGNHRGEIERKPAAPVHCERYLGKRRPQRVSCCITARSSKKRTEAGRDVNEPSRFLNSENKSDVEIKASS